ncbi:aldose 1-epimerase [Paenibacillus sp. F411]|uniref:Aldose 1-epimerase n=1 Tax=Paenibacillus algicola TaxID=2565926 RepID=A0A4P8XNZ9_9BACL|nr:MULTISPECIES: aldose 1-epimerase [Paenibacillus]MBO2943895.1 aldose 1-epimerase [Paenibacillus sp. F411]QCT04193.1 Aldose 1-epimerase [Paenibacillus algicola]
MNQVTKGQWNDYDTYTLNSGSLEVTILPRLGNNVIGINDLHEERQIIRRPDESELAFYLQKPYHFGMPLLIPPGRISKGRFQYAGQDYQFDQNTVNDNHIHGLHRTQAWCVSDIEEDEEGCSVTTELHTSDDPHWLQQLPEPLKLQMVFHLQGTTLQQRLRVSNLGTSPVPFGMGYHTWFLLDGSPQNWQLRLPVDHICELDEEQVPTGGTVPLHELAELQHGMSLAGSNLDTIFKLQENQPAEAVLTRNDGYTLHYSGDSSLFKHWVLYTKGEAQDFLCIEPYTWLPNAPNLPLSKEETGLIELLPGSSVELVTTLQIRRPESSS